MDKHGWHARHPMEMLAVNLPKIAPGRGACPAEFNKDSILMVPRRRKASINQYSVLARAEALAMGRDPAADDAALAPFGDVDPVDWSIEAVRALMAERALRHGGAYVDAATRLRTPNKRSKPRRWTVAFRPTLPWVFDEILKYEGPRAWIRRPPSAILPTSIAAKPRLTARAVTAALASSWSHDMNTTLRPTSSGNGLARTLSGS
jgi:hypothetical protein